MQADLHGLLRFHVAYSVDVPWCGDVIDEPWRYELSSIALWTKGKMHFIAMVPTASEQRDFFIFDCMGGGLEAGKGVGRGQRYNSRDAMSLLRSCAAQLWFYARTEQVDATTGGCVHLLSCRTC